MIAAEVIIFILAAITSPEKVNRLRSKAVRKEQDKCYQPYGIVRGLSFFFSMFRYMAMAFVSLVIIEIYKPVVIFGFEIPYELVISLPLTAQMITSMVGSFISGKVSDRFGWKVAACVGVLLMAAGSLCSALSTSSLPFIGSQLIFGLGLGVYKMAVDLYAVMVSSDEKMEEYASNANASCVVGLSCASAIGAIISGAVGYSGAYLVMAFMGVLVTFLIVMFGQNVLGGEDVPGETAADASKPKKGFFDLQFVAYILFLVLPYYFVIMFVDYLFPVFANTQGMSTSQIGYVFLAYGVATSYIGTFLCRVLTKKLRTVLLMSLLVLALGSVSIASAEAKLVLGYCESDPYVEFDTQLYYLLLGMEEYGLIDGVADKLDSAMPAEEMWQIVSAINDPSWKIHFSPKVYISLIDARYTRLSEEEQSEKIDAMIDVFGVNLMLTMGTSAGLAIADLPSGTTLVNFVAADPFKSGIVAGTESSGYSNRWAHVDVDAFGRTIQVMDDVFDPDSVGVVYADNEEAYIYSGADVLDAFCASHDIAVHKQFVEDEFGEAANELYVQQMHDAHAALADSIDVYVLTTSLLEAEDYDYVLSPLFDAGVPVYFINSSYDVECGALLAAEASDFPNIGRFGADTLRRYLGGEALDTLPQIYQTAPFLVINYDTARRIGYRLSFDMLLSASTIYSSAAEAE